MKVYVYPADVFGCGYYRLIWPGRALQAQGHDVTVVLPHERTNALGQDIFGIRGVMSGDRLVDVRCPEDVDVIVMQRVTHKHLSQAVPLLRKKGVAVVIDMDDDLSTVHPDNPAWSQLHPHNEPLTGHSWLNAERACRDASLVTVSTPALLRRYAAHGRGRVVHNYVPTSYLDVKHEDSDVVGWGGSTHSHPDDLQVTGPAFDRLVRAGTRFRVIGNGDGVREALGMSGEIETSGVVQLPDWPGALTTLGVGIAPLANTVFNSAKSWLKPLEYAAVGVPCVASPRAEYRSLHKLGIGLLAERPKDWHKQVRRLLNDPVLRVELGDAGRQLVRESLTIEANAWRHAEAWSDALELTRESVIY